MYDNRSHVNLLRFGRYCVELVRTGSQQFDVILSEEKTRLNALFTVKRKRCDTLRDAATLFSDFCHYARIQSKVT